jgi:hypothetical protein
MITVIAFVTVDVVIHIVSSGVVTVFRRRESHHREWMLRECEHACPATANSCWLPLHSVVGDDVDVDVDVVGIVQGVVH